MNRWRANEIGTASNFAEKNRAKSEKQKEKRKGVLGEFYFSLIKRKPKQKIFHLFIKRKK